VLFSIGSVEGTQEISKKVGQAEFIPIPSLDLLKSPTSAVGHAGLYEPDDEDDDIDAADVEVDTITADIPIGVKGGVIVLNVEDGIREFAKEIIAKKKATGEYPHLPSSITGIFVHYFTKGIEEDFNRTFEKTPYSINRYGRSGSSTSKDEKAVLQGKRIITKAKKNDLVAKCGWDYWSSQISTGSITMEEAQRKMLESIKERTDYEEKGVFFDKNKTAGVKNFDWKSIVESSVASADATKIYSSNKIEMVVPDLMESYYSGASTANKKFIAEGIKSIVLFPTLISLAWNNGIKKYGKDGSNNPYGGAGEEVISSMDELIEFLDIKSDLQGCEIKAVHLVKNKLISNKDRFICFDVINAKKDRVLKLFGADKGCLTIYNK
jgi:hypothetical protein